MKRHLCEGTVKVFGIGSETIFQTETILEVFPDQDSFQVWPINDLEWEVNEATTITGLAFIFSLNNQPVTISTDCNTVAGPGCAVTVRAREKTDSVSW